MNYKDILILVCPAPFSASNTSLDYLRSTLGRSYMCNAEQTLVVAPTFSLNTFRLQVQPFGVTTNQFGTGKMLPFLLIYYCHPKIIVEMPFKRQNVPKIQDMQAITFLTCNFHTFRNIPQLSFIKCNPLSREIYRSDFAPDTFSIHSPTPHFAP